MSHALNMRIFLIAYACEPNRQSEPGLGWNIAGEIARRHNVTVLTRSNNREKIEKYLDSNPDALQKRIRFIYHDNGGMLLKFKKSIPFGDQLYFSSWLKTAVEAHKTEFLDYDIVHQLTFSPFFVKPWGAEYTSHYVWGPIGGGGGAEARFPKGFPLDGWYNRFVEWLYRCLDMFVYSPLAWRFSRLRRKVAAVTFKAKAFSNGFPVVPDQISAIVQETGYDGPIRQRQYNKEKHPLKVMAVGRMIPHKAFEYSIRGFAKFMEAGGDGELHIFGDGPLRAELESLAHSILSKSSAIVFHGNVPNVQVHDALDSADVYLHTSFIEAAAWSILEAMVHGVPVVCQNRSGMADMVSRECGIKVIGRTPDELVRALAEALMRYYQNPEFIALHGQAGQARVRKAYTWEAVGTKIDEIYEKVLAK